MRHPSVLGRGLKAGDLVRTGAPTRALWAAGADAVGATLTRRAAAVAVGIE